MWRVKNEGATDFAGDVYVYEDDTVTAGVPQTASLIRAKVRIGNNQTTMALHTIPAGETGFLYRAGLTSGKDNGMEMRMRSREVGGVFQVKLNEDIYRTAFERIYRFPLVFQALTDIEVSAKGEGGSTPVSSTFSMVMIENEHLLY